ncbi:ABC transporter permease [Lichenicola sp.]|uniref:ABC transporter permease n=1 Tax=Lichenicola sp. TaxID=2804529 RepID=UPI003AFF6847
MSGLPLEPAARGSRLSRPISGAGLSGIILLVVFALSVAVNPAFLSWSTIRLQLVQAALIGIVAIGETLVILLGQIDLSIPWTMTFSGILASNLYAAHPHAWVPIVVVLAVGVAVGLLNTLGVWVLRVHSLIWTLSVNLILQGLTLVYTNAAASAPTVPPVARWLALGHVASIPVAAIAWACCAVVTIVALRAMPYGRRVYSIGTSELAALMSGVPVGRIYAASYLASGIGAALAGLMLSGYASQAYLGMGDGYLLPPVAAVVIGGTRLSGGKGGYLGTIGGCLSVILLQAMLVSLNVSEGLRQVVFGMILLGLVLLFARRRG